VTTRATSLPAAPDATNSWHARHVERLLASHLRLTGRPLYDGPEQGIALAQAVFEADFALLSHGRGADPLFDYANHTALELFELDWPTLTATPSRASAELGNQEARERFMREVRELGYAEGYSGVRISANGRRFVIADATVWNVVDSDGTYHGQAAAFPHWHHF